MISCLPVLDGVNGRPASSRDEEEKYSECVSRYRFRRFLTVIRTFDSGDREGCLAIWGCEERVCVCVSPFKLTASDVAIGDMMVRA